MSCTFYFNVCFNKYLIQQQHIILVQGAIRAAGESIIASQWKYWIIILNNNIYFRCQYTLQ